jgi:hypothetical protein
MSSLSAFDLCHRPVNESSREESRRGGGGASLLERALIEVEGDDDVGAAEASDLFKGARDDSWGLFLVFLLKQKPPRRDPAAMAAANGAAEAARLGKEAPRSIEFDQSDFRSTCFFVSENLTSFL